MFSYVSKAWLIDCVYMIYNSTKNIAMVTKFVFIVTAGY